ncbi:hypothetical protein LCGC14_0622990 [marine sediment metagenome]|uniref:DUF2190 domain-containing protein n=1 Tax=marine sediment metagenome TaxID=412755 RepID=A0A0F9RNK8_9ZZZZ
MAVNRLVRSVTYPSDGDNSGNQYRIVALDDAGRVQVQTAAATPVLGVLQNKPGAIDAAAEVAIVGSIVKLEAGAAVSERDAIQAVAGGRGSPTTTEDDDIVGYALTPAAGSAELFEVVITAPAQFRT